MKTQSLFLLSLFALTLFAGCQKDNNAPEKEVTPKQQCRVSQMIDQHGTVFQFSYTDAGKVKTVSVGATELWTYNYSGNTVIKIVTDYDSFVRKTTVQLNDAGLPVSILNNYDQSGTNWSKYDFEYDGNLVTKESYTNNNHQTPGAYTFVNDGHNIIQAEGVNGMVKFTYYDNKQMQPGDGLNYIKLVGTEDYMVFWGIDIIAFANTNLVKSVSNYGSTAKFYYSFDADGKIISMTSSNSSKMVQYQYECQ